MMKTSMLIYCPNPSANRLTFVLDWIFIEQLQLDYQLTSNQEEWSNYAGPKINYSKEHFYEDNLLIKPNGILFENTIQEQQLSIQRWKKTTVLFYNQPGKKIPFDLFSAVFYLISRYEEYLPHTKDMHGRYDLKQSAAFTYSFLDVPLIDLWLFHFRQILESSFSIQLPKKEFQLLQSFDIDMAWKFLHKDKIRNYGAYLKSAIKADIKGMKQQISVMNEKVEDPFFSFPALKRLHEQYQIKPLFFILLAKRLSAYDRNTDPENPQMQKLVHQLAKCNEVGIHPSYQSHESKAILQEEIDCLSNIIKRPVSKSRQHFIKFTLPETYRNLIESGIKEDYSMGYALKNGFRASTSNSFLWYDLPVEKTSDLRIHPFAFMDASSKFHLKLSTDETFKEWTQIYRKIKEVDGTLISIWHNYILSNRGDEKSWLPLYEKVLKTAYSFKESEQ